MSAIYGLYYKDGIVNDYDAENIINGFGKYKFDKSGTFTESSVFLGCHLNYLVSESINEVLPKEDESGSFVITADAIIYNRKELFNLISIPENKKEMPDSLLILEAYKIWGISCTEKLVGDYAFVIWDKQKDELFCVRDHVGKRTFYYYNDNDKFAFSTLINPLFKVGGIKKQLNNTYIADFLTLTGIRHEIDAHITIFHNIFQLPPANAMLVSKNGIKMWRYWEIKKTKEIHFDTDEEYEEAFRRIYSEAVRCRLRSIKKVGIMLSGGLDSGSAACLAAKELKNRNEKLFSFTQVPMEGYKNWLSKNQLADEREYVEEICKFTSNIEPYYIASKSRNSLTEINELIEILEQPYKYFENSYWLNEIYKTANSMDVGILLVGQSGNSTVSWGNFNAYITYLLKTNNLCNFFKEIRAFSKMHNSNPVKLCFNSLLNFMPYEIKKLVHKIRGGKDYNKLLSPINPAFFSMMKMKKRLKKYHVDTLFIDHRDSFGERIKIMDVSAFSHLGAIETKIALAFGVEIRDPTRDKRLIEFCINLPENQWVRKGHERRLIRCAMKGHMPDKVRLNTTIRGKQAADWVQRIMPDWDKACEEIADIGSSERERKYLDIPRIQEFLNKNKELKYDDNGLSGVRLLIRALIFARFIKSFDSQTGNLPNQICIPF